MVGSRKGILEQIKWGRGKGESEGRERTRSKEKEREKRVIREVVEGGGGGYGRPKAASAGSERGIAWIVGVATTAKKKTGLRGKTAAGGNWEGRGTRPKTI